ncbi:hypothetical protein ACE193_00260 [Bernardetia sp. OM2101]|uniref:hypothetical protein n=1 Tax=Bernardetia sp. OM2101 TaxID=3344876 RepID=UPI0035D123D1
MKINIAKNKYYHIEIDKTKNRAYFSILAVWNGIENFSTFFEEWKQAITELKNNFTILADLRMMPILSKEIENLFSQTHNYFVENGLFQVAEVAALNDISNLQIDRLENKNQIPKNTFPTIEQAEEYLNQQVKNIEN